MQSTGAMKVAVREPYIIVLDGLQIAKHDNNLPDYRHWYTPAERDIVIAA